MKPTLRRSGRHHVTVRVEHHLDLDTLAHIVAEELEDQEGERLARSRVENAVRDHLFRQGGETMDWTFDLDDPVFHWARDEVVRLWPEFAKDL